jgi:hypothetical protein
MGLHTELPIYKVAYDLFDMSTELARNMPRDFKQSVGGKLRDECLEITVLIFRANCARIPGRLRPRRLERSNRC